MRFLRVLRVLFVSWAGLSASAHGAVPTLAEIRRITPQPLRHVIVTHYHADHIYGLQVFKADWSRFETLPLFRAANRMNAYNTCLLMEQQPGP